MHRTDAVSRMLGKWVPVWLDENALVLGNLSLQLLAGELYTVE